MPQWMVEKTLEDPSWLESVWIDVAHQSDRIEHIRAICTEINKPDTAPLEHRGLILIEFHLF